jgi:two-component system, OmpR family, sensor histidine kinase KdpD
VNRGLSARSTWVGLLAGAVLVAAITGLIFALRGAVPVLSTGVLYLVAVLLVAGYWGLWLGLLTAAASALAFNFFHIPPTGRFVIAESENLVGLVVYFIAALFVSALATAARSRQAEAERRQREADLALELALILLAGGGDPLAMAADRIGAALEVPGVRLDSGWVMPEQDERALPLLAGGQRVGTILFPSYAGPEVIDQLERRLAPAIGVLMDARTRRDRLEEELVENKALRRSEALKTALLRAVSHDLRSPLTAIAAAAGGIDSQTLSPAERREIKEVISGEADRLTNLVANLLDLSRLESGSLETRSEPTAIEEVLEAAGDNTALSSAALDVELDRDLPLVEVDPAHLERALSNLLENAVRHSDGEPVAVRAHAQGSRLVLRITDQGPGIAAADLAHIFEPFYRGTNASGSGAGLGLAIAKGLIEAIGGRLWARSLPGQGATFGVDLPVAESAATAAGPVG